MKTNQFVHRFFPHLISISTISECNVSRESQFVNVKSYEIFQAVGLGSFKPSIYVHTARISQIQTVLKFRV